MKSSDIVLWLEENGFTETDTPEMFKKTIIQNNSIVDVSIEIKNNNIAVSSSISTKICVKLSTVKYFPKADSLNKIINNLSVISVFLSWHFIKEIEERDNDVKLEYSGNILKSELTTYFQPNLIHRNFIIVVSSDYPMIIAEGITNSLEKGFIFFSKMSGGISKEIKIDDLYDDKYKNVNFNDLFE